MTTAVLLLALVLPNDTSSASDSAADSPEQAVSVDPIESDGTEDPIPQAGRIVFERTNAFRRGKGLDELTRDDTLDRAAQAFADYMARTGNYGHTANGQQPAERIADKGYEYCRVGENIGWQQKGDLVINATELGHSFFTGWRDSPPHRENILTPSFTQIGLGFRRSDSGRYFGVQLFGRPQSLRFAIELENQTTAPVTYDLDGRTYQLNVRSWRQHTVCEETELIVDGLDPKQVGSTTRWVIKETGSITEQSTGIELVRDGEPHDLTTTKTD